MIKQISHLGMAVRDLEKAREFYRSVLGLSSAEPITGGDGTIQVSMVKAGEVMIELLQPVGNEGVMAKFLEKHGEGFHHICYEVEDINEAVSSLKASGMEVLG
jgi:methylmalonyl-CoA/ethylmalonyl-CoA epimerase